MTFYRVIRDGVLMGVFMDVQRAQRYRGQLVAERREVYRQFGRLREFEQTEAHVHWNQIVVVPEEITDMHDALCVVTKD